MYLTTQTVYNYFNEYWEFQIYKKISDLLHSLSTRSVYLFIYMIYNYIVNIAIRFYNNMHKRYNMSKVSCHPKYFQYRYNNPNYIQSLSLFEFLDSLVRSKANLT